MIFLKHFDTSKQTLLGAGKAYMLRTSKVGDLAPIINEKMRWSAWTPLKLYEVSVIACIETFFSNGSLPSLKEIKPGMIELMKTKLTFTQSEIQDGVTVNE